MQSVVMGWSNYVGWCYDQSQSHFWIPKTGCILSETLFNPSISLKQKSSKYKKNDHLWLILFIAPPSYPDAFITEPGTE